MDLKKFTNEHPNLINIALRVEVIYIYETWYIVKSFNPPNPHLAANISLEFEGYIIPDILLSKAGFTDGDLEKVRESSYTYKIQAHSTVPYLILKIKPK